MKWSLGFSDFFSVRVNEFIVDSIGVGDGEGGGYKTNSVECEHLIDWRSNCNLVIRGRIKINKQQEPRCSFVV